MRASRLSNVLPALTIGAALAIVGGPSAFAQEGGRPISVALTGAAEAPTPGDPDGSGTATLRINPGQQQVCYELSVTGIAAATAAHIHKAPVGAAGPVVVALTAPTPGSSKGCAEVTRQLALEILKTPADYYVNVHNAAFPGGAVRGQLSK
ncbi:CHRD domain-containing protein [Phenylobacterium sp. LH3H17]|uniref:CHRD domain-containing protein n=1 Tax=Phenylobacterium sp. LH3H17 TaxID=2903901 RepID=UPI0020C93A09|nr:CHRD domain-containing protein [Phenylobacterium sp. LH3H17]UTP40648.1 CHRD domain-containing protein [Phenylobacterium sp. LH3H17]